nr:hypothetical protein [Tanacetum cinerariifolium]
MVAILEKGEFNIDFHPMVDFIAASPLRYALTVKPTIFVSYIRQFWSTARIETTDEGTHILATVDGIQRTVSESSLRCNLKLRDEDGIISIPDTELFENLTLMGVVSLFATMLVHQGEGSGTPTEPHHTPSPEADTSHPTTSSILLPSPPTDPIPLLPKPTQLPSDVSEGEACPTKSVFIADQDRATIAKSFTLPHDSAPRAQEVEILRFKERVQVLEDKESVAAKQSGDDAPIKGMSINEREATAERISDDSEELARVLTSMDAATILAGELMFPLVVVPFLLLVPLLLTFPLAVKLLPLLVQLLLLIQEERAKELEEQQEKGHMRMNEQIARDAEVARIHAEEELQDEPASTVRDDSQVEACPNDSSFIADQDRATIAKSSTLPRDSAPRVTSPATEEGSMQQTLNELTAFCTSLQRQHSELLTKFQAQEVEIIRLKERVKVLE